MEQRLRSGELRLAFQQEGGRGYLDAALDALGIPVSSQTLVFSKTSAQFRLISPTNPRALYFNDDVYVGWVPGGPFLEVSAATAEGQAVFYTLPQDPDAAPSFRLDAQGSCLQCHDSARTDGVQGHMLRSVYPDPEGMPFFSQGTVDVRPSTPLAERWGGWYVTGKTGGVVHRGNAVIAAEDRTAQLDEGPGVDVTDLAGRFNVERYLTPHSDVVAHLVLTHQVRMHNAIAFAAREARKALDYRDATQERFGELSEASLASIKRRIERPADKVVSELLFLDEAPLGGLVTGTSGFAEEFAAVGPRDEQGRSLRELNLNARLLKYRCSWLIYSDAFDGMPEETKDYVYRRLGELLVGEEGEAIREILIATKPEARERLIR
jgi:hypothetical protein